MEVSRKQKWRRGETRRAGRLARPQRRRAAQRARERRWEDDERGGGVLMGRRVCAGPRGAAGPREFRRHGEPWRIPRARRGEGGGMRVPPCQQYASRPRSPGKEDAGGRVRGEGSGACASSLRLRGRLGLARVQSGDGFPRPPPRRVGRARQQRTSACASLSGARQASAAAPRVELVRRPAAAGVGEAAWTDPGGRRLLTGDCDTAGSGGGIELGGGGGGSSSSGDTAGAASGSSFLVIVARRRGRGRRAADGLRAGDAGRFVLVLLFNRLLHPDRRAGRGELVEVAVDGAADARRVFPPLEPPAAAARTDDCVSTDSAKPCAPRGRARRAPPPRAAARGARRAPQAGPPPSSSARSARCNNAAGRRVEAHAVCPDDAGLPPAAAAPH